MTGLPTQQNHYALLARLFDAGLKLSSVTEIRHQDGCPSQITARNLQCWCEPRVFVSGMEVTA